MPQPSPRSLAKRRAAGLAVRGACDWRCSRAGWCWAAAPLPPGEGVRIGWFRRSGRRWMMNCAQMMTAPAAGRWTRAIRSALDRGARLAAGGRGLGRADCLRGRAGRGGRGGRDADHRAREQPATGLPASPGAVSTSEAGPRLLGGRGSWELFGYGDGRVVRIQFASGRITQTAVPVRSVGPVSLVVGPHDVIISRLDYVPAYLVPDGRPARPFWSAWQWRNCDPGTAARDSMGGSRTPATSMPLVRMDGTGTGVSVRLPPFAPLRRGRAAFRRRSRTAGAVWWSSFTPKRVVTSTTYGSAASSRSPDRLAAVAARPGGWPLTARWPSLLVARGPGDRGPAHAARSLAGFLPGGSGVIAPDGSAAAIAAASGDRVTLHLLNLVSGSDQQIPVSLDAKSAGPRRGSPGHPIAGGCSS